MQEICSKSKKLYTQDKSIQKSKSVQKRYIDTEKTIR
jgi:hypothetical protein